MLQIGSLAFANPWMLLGLLSLPAIWWLMRVSPPMPRRVRFPAIRFLIGLTKEEETPARTPFWLLLLRMAIAAFVVLALAEPLWNPARPLPGAGPVILIVDNGWTAAAHWDERRATMENIIAEAGRSDRAVLLTGTVPEAARTETGFETADKALARARAMTPYPIEPNRIALAEKLEGISILPEQAPQIIWISDGLDYGAAAQFAARLGSIAGNGKVTLIEPYAGRRALALLPPENKAGDFSVSVLRSSPAAPREGIIRALARDGNVLAETLFELTREEIRKEVVFTLPVELRNRVARLEIAGEKSAGATMLMDERWQQRNVGIISGAGTSNAQPLLSDTHYLTRALSPYVTLREISGRGGMAGEIDELLSSPLSVLILSDVGVLPDTVQKRVTEWVEAGGTLLRFAGPRMAEQHDDLVPVPLRSGGRALGGALSWSTPQGLSPFEADSPFYGIDIRDDVSISRQVLAQPVPDLAARTWARLEDGTPLVTAAQRGRGTIVLFHVTANRDWSNLPLSGLYVETLRRVVSLSHVPNGGANGNANATATQASETLSPIATLDGYGRLGTPPATATAIPLDRFVNGETSLRHPPGLYGTALSPRALNATATDLELKALPHELQGITQREHFPDKVETRLAAAALTLALVLVILDMLAALWVTGLFETERIRKVRFALRILPAFLICFLLTTPMIGDAVAGDEFALQASLETRLAYVLTGDAETDRTSEAGLSGLNRALRARTAFEPGVPMGVNIERDEIAFFPILYWPMSPTQQSLSPQTLDKINTYMKNGGMILFDTRDQDRATSSASTQGTETLRRLLGNLDLPPLEPVPADHVLTKSFYILTDFPGRWRGGQLWVEAMPDTTVTSNDGVSSIIVGANDYAAAWARDERGRPLYPVTPGGERQREMAERFGVNLVIYALTGNYKADQVHVPALLERMGR